MKYLARTYNPDKEGIKIKNLVVTKDKSVFVRLDFKIEAKKLRNAVALQDCSFSIVRQKRPKLFLFGIKCESKEDLKRDLFVRNPEIQDDCEGEFREFDRFFCPYRTALVLLRAWCRPTLRFGDF